MDWKATLLPLMAPYLVAGSFALILWVGKKAGNLLEARTAGTKYAAAVGVLESLAASVVAHAEVNLRPLLVSAIAGGGKLSPTDAAALRAQALNILKSMIGDAAGAMKAALHIADDSAWDVYLSGLLERTLGVQKAAGTLPASMPDVLAARAALTGVPAAPSPAPSSSRP